MKSNSSFLIVKKLIQVLFLRVYTNISAVKAVSIHSCFSTCGRISFFFPGDIISVWFSSSKKWWSRACSTLLFFKWHFFLIVYKKTDESSDEWQTTSDNEWYNEQQRMTTSGATSDKEWQRVTTNGNEWHHVRSVVQWMKTAWPVVTFLYKWNNIILWKMYDWKSWFEKNLFPLQKRDTSNRAF